VEVVNKLADIKALGDLKKHKLNCIFI